ncbi:unnamed protein product [Polarella glacialis]|uniref:PDZ domain-containing protein n=2 Tax=Polarella glacialis TaxID=89957 RepID=A0A813HGY7_POLGL|nr:unnamed protein product [Polarella glacialis]
MSDFVGDAVHGIAGGVRGALDWVTGEESSAGAETDVHATHKVVIGVAELFGEERSIGLRLEERLVTRFTKPEAEKLGWRLGDCIIGVGSQPVRSQDEMLTAIAEGKEALKANGTPIRFLVERLGPKPTTDSFVRGAMVTVNGRIARIQEVQDGAMVVQFQDDGTRARVPTRR